MKRYRHHEHEHLAGSSAADFRGSPLLPSGRRMVRRGEIVLRADVVQPVPPGNVREGEILMFDQDHASELRRLPVYLLLDTSGSMAGAPLQAVQEGLKMFEQVIQDDPHALETAHVSVITFGGTARQVSSLVPADQFRAPSLAASGGTPMGEALMLLDEAIDKEVRLRSTDQKADYKPLIFLLTDGQPNSGRSWQDAIESIRRRTDRKMANLIAIGAGTDADLGMLKQLGGTVLSMADMSTETCSALFEWLSQSVKLVSQPRSDPKATDTTLPPPPPTIQVEL